MRGREVGSISIDTRVVSSYDNSERYVSYPEQWRVQAL